MTKYWEHPDITEDERRGHILRERMEKMMRKTITGYLISGPFMVVIFAAVLAVAFGAFYPNVGIVFALWSVYELIFGTIPIYISTWAWDKYIQPHRKY